MSYRVVKIISNDRIVVNAGKNDVRVGQIMKIVVPNGEEVIDPLTGESLGRLDYTKAELRVEVVYDNMCICVNNIDLRSRLSAVDGAFSLDVDTKQITGGYGVEETNKEIKIGDIVEIL